MKVIAVCSFAFVLMHYLPVAGDQPLASSPEAANQLFASLAGSCHVPVHSQMGVLSLPTSLLHCMPMDVRFSTTTKIGPQTALYRMHFGGRTTQIMRSYRSPSPETHNCSDRNSSSRTLGPRLRLCLRQSRSRRLLLRPTDSHIALRE